VRGGIKRVYDSEEWCVECKLSHGTLCGSLPYYQGHARAQYSSIRRLPDSCSCRLRAAIVWRGEKGTDMAPSRVPMNTIPPSIEVIHQYHRHPLALGGASGRCAVDLARQRLWPAVCVPGSLRTKSLEAVSSRVNALHLIYVYTHTHTHIRLRTNNHWGGVKETYIR